MTPPSPKTQQSTASRTSARHTTMLIGGLLVVGSAILALADQDWRNLAIAMILFVLVFAPMLAERWVNVTVPGSLQFQYGLLLLMGPYLGGYWRWYELWQPWDTVVHFYSGFFASFALIFALGKTAHTYRLKLPVWVEIVMLITAKATIALFWEIGEFIFDLVFDTRTQGGNSDTMTDMMAGLFPAFLIAAALYAYRRYGTFRYIGSLEAAGRLKRS